MNKIILILSLIIGLITIVVLVVLIFNNTNNKSYICMNNKCVKSNDCSSQVCMSKSQCEKNCSPSTPTPTPTPISKRVANERYYSYAKTILEGGVMPSIETAMDSLENDSLDDQKTPIFSINYGIWKNKNYVDWDASSGLLCGNTWGKPSNQAEIFYNLISLNSKDPILGDVNFHKDYLNTLFYNQGECPTDSDWKVTNCILQAPANCTGKMALWGSDGKSTPDCLCCQNNVWGTNPGCSNSNSDCYFNPMNYNTGFMGFNSYNLGLPTKNDNTVWGHFGSTYGYNSLTIIIPSSSKYFINSPLLKGIDITFVSVQNSSDVDQQNHASIIGEIIQQNKNITTIDDLTQYITQAIQNVYNKLKNQQHSGITKDLNNTVGFYYIDNNNNPQSGWRTVRIDSANNPVTVEKQYPFKGKFLGYHEEPSYYFGSGTKPITAMLVTKAIYDQYKNKNQNTTNFIDWYIGSGYEGNRAYSYTGNETYGAVTMGEILKLAPDTKYIETLNDGKTSETIQNLITKYIYTKDACKYKGKSQDTCPSSICQQWWGDDNYCWEVTNGGNPQGWPGTWVKDPNNPGGWMPPNYPYDCKCPTIDTSSFPNIFFNMMGPYDLSNMRCGIPDADTLSNNINKFLPGNKGQTALDTIDQLYNRAHSIGPVGYASELIGLDWIPGYNDSNYPNTAGLSIPTLPPASYTSSGYTLLGCLLWIFDPNNTTQTDWWNIDINNSYLPKKLSQLINFAGTSGNNGTKYMVQKGETV